MMRGAQCLLVILSAVAINGLTASVGKAEDKSVKPIKEWSAKFPNQEEEFLMKEAPKSGYIANETVYVDGNTYTVAHVDDDTRVDIQL
jgi:hypothetical protein